mmetsp:Transcript_51125/g.82686  ORF Transcript_51125/g.82686 Transcript_51125/m.82686 type:complete len:203 (+) Transcript_51125:934-1542(+)
MHGALSARGKEGSTRVVIYNFRFGRSGGGGDDSHNDNAQWERRCCCSKGAGGTGSWGGDISTFCKCATSGGECCTTVSADADAPSWRWSAISHEPTQRSSRSDAGHAPCAVFRHDGPCFPCCYADAAADAGLAVGDGCQLGRCKPSCTLGGAGHRCQPSCSRQQCRRRSRRRRRLCCCHVCCSRHIFCPGSKGCCPSACSAA